MIGMMRVKDEARWIERCVRSILPVCERVYVMDDHSSDGTAEICEALPNVTVLHSPFNGIDEVRDKNWLLNHVRAARGDWVLAIDGDEMLTPGDEEKIAQAVQNPDALAYSLRILYLWDSETMVRIDGVYGRFMRPSLFRALSYSFPPSGAGCNFHCGNVPRPLQMGAWPLNASLLHFGYMHRADRIRKFEWYNTLDPNNLNEDRYLHMIQGDVEDVPASARLRHAGPMQLRSVECTTTAA